MSIQKLNQMWDEADGYVDDLEGFTVIDEGEWEQDCKYQHCTTIVQDDETKKYYAINQSRSGSYHTDWYYDDPDFREVERIEELKVVVTWKSI